MNNESTSDSSPTNPNAAIRNPQFPPPARLSSPKSTPPSTPTPPSPDPSPTRGRPRKLDDLKRHEICALVAGGCSLREAAKYVGCGINTVRRELARNPKFSVGVRSSQMSAQLSPLRAMQQAATTHWRAAAWMLERAYPERFARRDPSSLHARQARQLLNEVIHIVRAEIPFPDTQSRLVTRLKSAFDDAIRAAGDSRRTSGELRQALEFLEGHESNHPAEPGETPSSAG